MGEFSEVRTSARLSARRDLSRSHLALVFAILVGVLARGWVLQWADPWGPHHPDEGFLPLESVAIWEGVAPRELGWPASTTRLAMSAAAATEWALDRGAEAWQHRADPQAALETVATWIGHRFVDPTPLYKLGRLVSILTGITQLFAVAWALRRWVVRPSGVAIGTLVAAMAPLAVLYSQYVLADVAGLLCATIVVGLAADIESPRILTMAALVGLAASSKYHFGLWLLTPLACLWLRRAPPLTRKISGSLGAVGMMVWVIAALVPWFWTNPLLPVKEFGFVVLGKVGGAFTVGHGIRNISLIFGGLGALAWFGAVLGLTTLRRNDIYRIAPVVVPLVVGSLMLAKSEIVFDRHGLVLMPAVMLLAALGWARYLSAGQPRIRIAAAIALVVCVVLTGVDLVRAEREAGEAGVDRLATEWILSNVPRGSRVAVSDEMTATLPRTGPQLRACIEKPLGPDAYREKWQVLGYPSHDSTVDPMRSAILNDELYYAYWCSRELGVQQDPGFFVVPYHNEPRFNAVLEEDVLNRFRAGPAAPTSDGIDVLVVNRTVDVGMPPAKVVQTRRGQRVIYVR